MASQNFVRRKSVKDIVTEAGLLPAEKLEEAVVTSKNLNKTLQHVLVEEKLVDRKKLVEAIQKAWQVKAVELAQLEIDPDIVKLLPEAMERRHHATPFMKDEKSLFVAMADPRDFFVIEDVQLRTGLEVKAYLALPDEIHGALDKAYGKGEEAVLNKLLESVNSEEIEGNVEVKQDSKADITDVDHNTPEVEKVVNAIILGALKEKTSDIHIEPFEDPTGKNSKMQIRFRVDGFLRDVSYIKIPWNFRNAVMAKLKIMTGSMNITERRIPQSGRIQVVAQGNPIEFRVEVVPTAYGESAVMRILDRKSIQVDINKMGFLPDTLDKFLGLMKGVGGKKNFGLVLVCGPTGSGKSTTLYSALNYINRPDIKILTAENPVEYNLDGIVQVPVNPDLQLSQGRVFDFAAALRSFLRLDPDVIMVGEIRDKETAHIAMEAAMTGHLVFSTIHTNDAPSAISRLTEMHIPAFLVATTIKAILAQRLGRRICVDCKQEFEPSPADIAVFKEHDVAIPKGTKFYKGRGEGCDTCKGSGYKGRCGFHELLVMTDKLRVLALKEVASDPLKKMAVEEGMRTIIQDGLHKVLQGYTTIREVLGGAE